VDAMVVQGIQVFTSTTKSLFQSTGLDISILEMLRSNILKMKVK